MMTIFILTYIAGACLTACYVAELASRQYWSPGEVKIAILFTILTAIIWPIYWVHEAMTRL